MVTDVADVCYGHEVIVHENVELLTRFLLIRMHAVSNGASFVSHTHCACSLGSG